VIGLQVRYLLGGVVVIERIFGIQGLGRWRSTPPSRATIRPCRPAP